MFGKVRRVYSSDFCFLLPRHCVLVYIGVECIPKARYFVLKAFLWVKKERIFRTVSLFLLLLHRFWLHVPNDAAAA